MHFVLKPWNYDQYSASQVGLFIYNVHKKGKGRDKKF